MYKRAGIISDRQLIAPHEATKTIKERKEKGKNEW